MQPSLKAYRSLMKTALKSKQHTLPVHVSDHLTLHASHSAAFAGDALAITTARREIRKAFQVSCQMHSYTRWRLYYVLQHSALLQRPAT